eukprot:gene8150-10892_t
MLAAARWGGVLFLGAYGLHAARRAWSGGHLTPGHEPPMKLRAALATCLAFTYLNPHCWLDTVVLLGSLSSQQPPEARVGFACGAAAASLLWFTALGYGARLLAPVFARPAAWRILDGTIAAVMGSLALSLAWGPPTGSGPPLAAKPCRRARCEGRRRMTAPVALFDPKASHVLVVDDEP